MFKSSNGFEVRPVDFSMTGNSEPGYIVTTPVGDHMVDTLRDECSCAAMQGIACEHKQAVDEYVEHLTTEAMAQEQAEGSLLATPEPDPRMPEVEHRPSYRREHVGMTDTTPARPIHHTIVTCSCRWQATFTKKDQAKVAFRAHRDGTTTEEAAGKVATQDPAQVYENREDWLHAAKLLWFDRMRLFGHQPVENVRVGVGFTYSKRKTVRAECWRKENSDDGTYEIVMGNGYADSLQAFLSLGHELSHTNMDPGTGHGPAFRKYVVSLGFKRPVTDSANITDELKEWAEAQLKELGRYPHAKLEARTLEGGKPRQTNRWRKYHCAHPDCGWIVRAPKAGFVGFCTSESHDGEPFPLVPGWTEEGTEQAPENA